MLFGINLGGGTLPHESRGLAMKSRLTKSYLAKSTVSSQSGVVQDI